MAFWHKQGNLVINMEKNSRIMQQKEDKCCKTASERVVQKTAGATGDLMGNKIADKINSLGKTKSKEKKDERQEITRKKTANY